MALPPPPGIYVPVPTFFHPPTSSTPLALNLPLQSAHSLHLARSGIRGLVVAGSTGEAVHLTQSERYNLISSTREALTKGGFPEYPIIAGVASDSVQDALAELKNAKEAGAQFGMVLVPNYFASAGKNRNLQEGIIRWFKDVADKSPIPILIYHYPGVSNNVSFPVNTYLSLAPHPNIVGCKLSHGNVPIHLQLATLSLTHNFHVFSGLGQQLFPIICGGCHGAIDGLAGAFPKSLVHLFNSSWDFVNSTENITAEQRKEKLDKLRKLQVLVSKAEEYVEAEGTIGIKHAIGKEVFHGEGVEEGGFEGRPPLQGGLDKEEYAKWSEGVFVELRKLEESL